MVTAAPNEKPVVAAVAAGVVNKFVVGAVENVGADPNGLLICCEVVVAVVVAGAPKSEAGFAVVD